MATKTRRGSKKTTPELPYIPEPWDRLEDEGAQAFQAFVLYRDLPPHDRSIARAADAALGIEPGTRSGLASAKLRQFESKKRQFETWSAQNLWPNRALQYDEHRDKLRRAAEAAAVEEMGRRHANAAMKLVDAGLKALESVDPDELPFADLLRFITEGARLERLARGEPETTGIFDVNPPQDDVRALLSSDPEVAKAAAMLTATVAKSRRART